MIYKSGIYAPGTQEVIELLSKFKIDAIFTKPKREYIRNLQNTNLKVYVHTWTFRARQDRKYMIRNLFGKQLLWSDSGCPNHPSLKENNLKWIEEVLTNFEVNGITLDGIRFPSPGSGMDAFLSCFCDYCKSKAKELGYDLNAIKSVLKLFLKNFEHIVTNIHSPVDIINLQYAYPELLEWIRFRCDSIAEHVKMVQKTIKSLNSKVEFGAAVFSPSLSVFVGQDYSKLMQFLDFIQPMIYHRGDGIACINFEIARFLDEFFKKDIQKEIQKIFWFFGYTFPSPANTQQLTMQGLPLNVLKTEINRARFLITNKNCKLTPIFFIIRGGHDEAYNLRKILSMTPLDGIAYFAYYEDIEGYLSYLR